jgi:hypothetical protein
MLKQANALACCPPISSRAIFPSAFPRLRQASSHPFVGLTRTADFYGIGVILLAITSLAIALVRGRRT